MIESRGGVDWINLCGRGVGVVILMLFLSTILILIIKTRSSCGLHLPPLDQLLFTPALTYYKFRRVFNHYIEEVCLNISYEHFMRSHSDRIFMCFNTSWLPSTSPDLTQLVFLDSCWPTCATLSHSLGPPRRYISYTYMDSILINVCTTQQRIHIVCVSLLRSWQLSDLAPSRLVRTRRPHQKQVLRTAKD